MNLALRLTFSMLFLASVTAFVGCGDGTDESKDDKKAAAKKDDHKHELPETYAAAVAELAEIRDAVAKAAEGGDLNAAHDPLHEVGHVLEEVVALAKKASIEGENLDQVQNAVKDLNEGFGALDAKLHKDEKNGKSYSEVESMINDAIQVLESNLPAADKKDDSK